MIPLSPTHSPGGSGFTTLSFHRSTTGKSPLSTGFDEACKIPHAHPTTQKKTPAPASLQLTGWVVQVEPFTVGCRVVVGGDERWVQLPSSLFERAPWPHDRVALSFDDGTNGLLGFPRVQLLRDQEADPSFT